MACLTWRFQQPQATHAIDCIDLHCIFHESTGQEEVDPLSIAAEDSRLMWAQYCLVKYCGGEPTCESYLQAWYWQAVGETRKSILRVVF